MGGKNGHRRNNSEAPAAPYMRKDNALDSNIKMPLDMKYTLLGLVPGLHQIQLKKSTYKELTTTTKNVLKCLTPPSRSYYK